MAGRLGQRLRVVEEGRTFQEWCEVLGSVVPLHIHESVHDPEYSSYTDLSRRTQLEADSATVGDVLNHICGSYGLDFALREDRILLCLSECWDGGAPVLLDVRDLVGGEGGLTEAQLLHELFPDGPEATLAFPGAALHVEFCQGFLFFLVKTDGGDPDGRRRLDAVVQRLARVRR